MDGNPTILYTSRLSKAFGSLLAVDHIDLEVRRGDVFGFLGQNGSGKTTTIRLLLGLLRPTSGTIHIFGMDTATQLRVILPRLGALIEAPVFYGHLSGWDNLHVLATRSGMKSGNSAKQRIHGVLEAMDLYERKNDPYETYSLGMKQRLGVGAALLTDPDLILLDEPTNGLDPAGMHAMRQIIVQLAARGKTIFLSSHLLSEVQLLCNRAAIIHQGRLLRQGNIQDFLQTEKIVVRMATAAETERALAILQQIRSADVSWIKQVSQGHANWQQPVIILNAPPDRSSEIARILAQHHLFAVEIYHEQTSLEAFFLDLTTAAGEPGAERQLPPHSPSIFTDV